MPVLAKSFLSAGFRNGTICHVKMNLYAVTDLVTLRCAVNKYEIASRISDTVFVVCRSAVELRKRHFNALSPHSAFSGNPSSFFAHLKVECTRHPSFLTTYCL